MYNIKLFIKKILALIIPATYKYKIPSGLAKGFYKMGGFDWLKIISKNNIEQKYLLSLNLKNNIVCDVGANAGIFTMFFSEAVGKKGKVFAFEPNIICFDQLNKNIEINDLKNIETFNVALGDESGKKDLYYNPYWLGTGSLDKSIINNNHNLEKKKVQTIKMDSLLVNKTGFKPDFIKIDVEGFEYNVIKGMVNVIKNYKPTLFIEIHGADNRQKTMSVNNIYLYLTPYKYKIKHLESDTLLHKSNLEIVKAGHIYCYVER